jgi:23S rRNA (guanine745-N1)-methyltransferase
MLLCPVIGCRLPLQREEHRVVCRRSHSFDLARSGYINLLQPQERRSRTPGDKPEALAARRRLYDLGVGSSLLEAITNVIAPAKNDVLLDSGCGEGFYLGSIATATGCEGHGIDISTNAIEMAAKRYPSCEWVVANADRFLPYADGSFSIAMSITGRMKSNELARVLDSNGKLLVGIAAPDDLIELRGKGRDRVASTAEIFANDFRVARQTRITNHADLDEGAVRDALLSIYRPLQTREVKDMRVTFSLDLLLFEKK